jgi:3-dehydroquinate synthase
MGIDTKIVTIDLGLRSYDIYIGTGLLFRMAEFLPVDVPDSKFFIVTDESVEPYARQVQTVLQDAKAAAVEVLVLPTGEKTKSFGMLKRTCDWLLEQGVNRDSCVLAVGGGVIGDLAGFAASVVMRGLPYVQVPTTLLSQVDSSVGGKTGINTHKGKNLVGSFYQPAAVIIDLDTLKTLPKRQLLAGYAEVAKYGLIKDASFFTWLEEHGKDVIALDEASLSHAIEDSVKAKAMIVEVDEREQGVRALLNFGHTFGHALEASAGYDGRLLHGEAVAIGTVMAFDLSHRMDLCSHDDLKRVEQHFLALGLPVRASTISPALNADADALLDLMRLDKKVKKGKLRFILANGVGEAFVEDEVPEKLVKAVLEDSLGPLVAGEQRVNKNVKQSFGVSKVRGLWKSVFSSHS